MESFVKKCSLEEHIKANANSYCQECKIYMCKDCETCHEKLFKNHHKFNIKKEEKEEDIFTGLCKEYNHLIELEYYCKNHNILCCAKCITNFEDKENGHHKDCDICPINDFEKNKKEKLDSNIKTLEILYNHLEKSIKEINETFEKINESKEDLKLNIQKIFTKLRNELNNREDELFLEVDELYNYSFFNQNNIKKIKELPNKIKKLLDKVKSNNYNWRNNKLNLLINDCINLENNINEINKINDLNESIKKANPLFYKVEFIQDNYEQVLEIIKKFGFLKKSLENIFDSEIEIDENLVKLWLDKKKFISELLFRKSRDGSQPKEFHNKCDNKGITITFINTDEFKFGGYTELGWEGKGPKKDNSTFLFSFDKSEKYPIKNEKEEEVKKKEGEGEGEEEIKEVKEKEVKEKEKKEKRKNKIKKNNENNKQNKYSIFCNTKNGPTFGSLDRYEIYFNKTLDYGISYGNLRENNNKNYTFFNDMKLTNGERNWNVKELEVYKIIYI